MLEISLDERELKHGLGQLLKNATDTHPMMRAITTEMVSLTEDNFESESWGGQKWPRNKRTASGGGKTLQLSGQLAASISTKVGNDFACIGSNKKHAAIHHLGGKAGRGKKSKSSHAPTYPSTEQDNCKKGAERSCPQITQQRIVSIKKRAKPARSFYFTLCKNVSNPPFHNIPLNTPKSIYLTWFQAVCFLAV